MEISVIICTRNRARQLSNVLDSVAALTVPAGLAWELIVVDNGSSDNTRDVVQSYASTLPIRYVLESTAGLSNARNRGVQEAQGAYICWTDDDVELDRDWLDAYREAFLRHPDGAVFGGKILPRFTEPVPDWIEQLKTEWPVDGPVAYRDLGDAPMQLSFKGWKTPYGANFAVRTKEQKQHAYNPELGVSPTHKRVGEETEVIYQILKTGTGYWVPRAIVHHIIPQSRQSYRYVYDYFYLVGATFAYLKTHHRHDNHLLAASDPVLYHGPDSKLYIKLFKNLLAIGPAYLRGKRHFLGRLANIGFCNGAIRFKPIR